MSTRNDLIINISTCTVTYKGYYISFETIRPSFWLLIALLDKKTHSRISLYKLICSKVNQNKEYILTMEAVVSYLKKYEGYLITALNMLEIPISIQRIKINKGYNCNIIYNKLSVNIQLTVPKLEQYETITLENAKNSFDHKEYKQCVEMLETNCKFCSVIFKNTATLYLFLAYSKLGDFLAASEYAEKIFYVLLDKNDQVIYDFFIDELSKK